MSIYICEDNLIIYQCKINFHTIALLRVRVAIFWFVFILDKNALYNI